MTVRSELIIGRGDQNPCRKTVRVRRGAAWAIKNIYEEDSHMAEYTLKNEELTVTFRTQSAEIRSIRDNKTGQEYMWQADPAFWGWTSPILFPLVGPVAKNEFRYGGKTYKMKQHGFARQSEFDLCEMDGADIGFVLTDNEERLALYPFRFRLEVGYRLSGRTLTVLWKVTNPSEDEVLHFQIGAHPAFNTPPAEGMKKNECYIGFDTEGPLTVSLLNLGGDPGLTDETMKQELQSDGTLKITDELFDIDTLIVEHDQAHKLTLLTPDKKPYVTVVFDAPLFGVWSPKKDAPFFCLEPWYGRADRISFEGEIGEREWGNTLEPKGVFEASYDIILG